LNIERDEHGIIDAAMEQEPVIPLIPLEALIQLRQLLDSLQQQSDKAVAKTESPEQESCEHGPSEQSAARGF
jgi:hypothetical protein